MWFQHQTKQPILYLVIDDNQAALITWNTDHDTIHPFSVTSYTALPNEWFLHGVPWHISSFTTYLNAYITQQNFKKPLLVCACNGATVYEKTVTLTHTPTQANIPPDNQYAHYAWHASSLPTEQEVPSIQKQTFEISVPIPTQETTHPHTSPQEQEPTTALYLVNGMPYSDILRLRLCADKSGCTLHRVTTIRSSMQPVYTYCQRHGIAPTITQENSTHGTLLSALCTPLPKTHNHRLVLSALGLSLFERKLI